MLRFASNPNGDINITDLRVALFNHITAKQKKEDLIVRIQDLDKEKNADAKDKEILEILELFGIEYSQVIYQSEGMRFHTAMALQLIHDKEAFSCFCSDEWLDGKKKEAKAAKKPYKYDDACANLPAELVIDNLSPFTIRIKKPTDASDIDSFVIMNEDKTPSDCFASAVDDMLNDISIVIQSEEDMSNASKQAHIRSALKYEKTLDYVKLPILLGNELPSVKWLLEEGFLPDAISNYLISIGTKPPKKIFTLEESIEWFDLSQASSSSACFDMNALRDINKKHLLQLDNKELSRYVGFADEEIGGLAKVYLKEINTIKELKQIIATIFAAKEIPQKLKDQSALLLSTIKSAPYFEQYDDFKNYTMKESGLKEQDFLEVLRLLFTGTNDGISLEEIYQYIKNYIGEIVK
ncbi:MAG: glutamate--tRNA ligase family protein [Sulfurimonas sp.]|nr:glutamate--tRNA ligase family protein [Sulfurimonas sp.]MDQ7059969.1 glutamate--tRNA ligase family protein [Sulfurimonas sp.]